MNKKVIAGIWLVFVSAGICYSGNLDSPGPPAATMKTLDDIYNRISSGKVAGTHSLQPSGVSGSTMHTLIDIYDALPSGSTTTATAADVREGKTFIMRGGGVMTFSMGTAILGVARRTGQTPTVPYSAPTGSDGDLEIGMAWPNPRFTDNGDSTVTDNLSGLIWLSSANHIQQNYSGYDADGRVNWEGSPSAMEFIARMNAGTYGNAGHTDWRLPNINELLSLIAWQYDSPAVCSADGTAKWTAGDPFTDVRLGSYWSSTAGAFNTGNAWHVRFDYGIVGSAGKSGTRAVWPVRGGQ